MDELLFEITRFLGKKLELREGDSSITINSHPNQIVMKLNADGSVWWLRDGVMVRAEIDADLALAFAVVISEIMGMDPRAFIEELRRTK